MNVNVNERELDKKILHSLLSIFAQLANLCTVIMCMFVYMNICVLAPNSSLYMQHEVAHCSIGTLSRRSAPSGSSRIAATGECGQVCTRIIIITSVVVVVVAAAAVVCDARSRGEFHLRSPRSSSRG